MILATNLSTNAPGISPQKRPARSSILGSRAASHRRRTLLPERPWRYRLVLRVRPRAAGGNGPGVDPGFPQQLVRRAGAGHLAGGELVHRGTLAGLGQCLEHRITETTLGPVVFDGDDRATFAGGGADRLDVDRLDRVRVDNACVYTSPAS